VYGTTIRVRHGRSLLTLIQIRLATRPLSLAACTGANGHSREAYAWRLDIIRTHVTTASKGCVNVHGESYYGAHRLPAGKTAAKGKKRGRPAGQAAKFFEDRLLQVSKASARFVETAKFRHSGNQKSTSFAAPSRFKSKMGHSGEWTAPFNNNTLLMPVITGPGKNNERYKNAG